MFLHGKEARPTDTMIKRLARHEAARTLAAVLVFIALVVVALLTVYYVGPNGFPTVHHHRIYKPQTSMDHAT
jgi:predicted PurR-regulated permease PerM